MSAACLTSVAVLAGIYSVLNSTSCWQDCVHIAYTAPELFNCWPATHCRLCRLYQHDALNQSWVNVGPPSLTLAHIQHDAKQDTVTQYWAVLAQRRRLWTNISPALGQRLVFARTTPWPIGTAGQTGRHSKQTEVNQHVPTSFYRGGDIINIPNPT